MSWDRLCLCLARRRWFFESIVLTHNVQCPAILPPPHTHIASRRTWCHAAIEFITSWNVWYLVAGLPNSVIKNGYELFSWPQNWLHQRRRDSLAIADFRVYVWTFFDVSRYSSILSVYSLVLLWVGIVDGRLPIATVGLSTIVYAYA